MSLHLAVSYPRRRKERLFYTGMLVEDDINLPTRRICKSTRVKIHLEAASGFDPVWAT